MMQRTKPKQNYFKRFNKADTSALLALTNTCLHCETEEEFHGAIMDFASHIEFEFVLYGYKQSSYDKSNTVFLRNISNPTEWMEEYGSNGYLTDDPVREEFERHLARGNTCDAFIWDEYTRKLNASEQAIIERRTHYGLRYGFSAFCNSTRNDAMFLVSFASAAKNPDEKSLLLGEMIVPHLNRCRKRLDLVLQIDQLTSREQSVADWLIEGKTNWEIAQILDVSEATVKFHVRNILSKLKAPNRQMAVSVLIAERYLS